MDSYIDKHSNFSVGRLSVKNIVIKNFEHIEAFLNFLCRDDFRRCYFDNENISFEIIDELILLNVLRVKEPLFTQMMRSHWCRIYESVRCKIFDENSMYVYMKRVGAEEYFMDIGILGDINLSKMLVEKNFVFDEATAVYAYRNIPF